VTERLSNDFSDGEVLSAADLNDTFDELDAKLTEVNSSLGNDVINLAQGQKLIEYRQDLDERNYDLLLADPIYDFRVNGEVEVDTDSHEIRVNEQTSVDKRQESDVLDCVVEKTINGEDYAFVISNTSFSGSASLERYKYNSNTNQIEVSDNAPGFTVPSNNDVEQAGLYKNKDGDLMAVLFADDNNNERNLYFRKFSVQDTGSPIDTINTSIDNIANLDNLDRFYDKAEYDSVTDAIYFTEEDIFEDSSDEVYMGRYNVGANSLEYGSVKTSFGGGTDFRGTSAFGITSGSDDNIYVTFTLSDGTKLCTLNKGTGSLSVEDRNGANFFGDSSQGTKPIAVRDGEYLVWFVTEDFESVFYHVYDVPNDTIHVDTVGFVDGNEFLHQPFVGPNGDVVMAFGDNDENFLTFLEPETRNNTTENANSTVTNKLTPTQPDGTFALNDDFVAIVKRNKIIPTNPELEQFSLVPNLQKGFTDTLSPASGKKLTEAQYLIEKYEPGSSEVKVDFLEDSGNKELLDVQPNTVRTLNDWDDLELRFRFTTDDRNTAIIQEYGFTVTEG